MYNVSTTYKSKIKDPSRNLDGRLVVDGVNTVPLDYIEKFSISSSFGSGEMPVINSSISRELKLTLIKDPSIPEQLIGVPLVPEIALETSTGVWEWVPLGEFYANTGNITVSDNLIEIEAMDKIAELSTLTYSTNLNFPTLLSNVLNEIETNYGVTIDRTGLPSLTISKVPFGSVREVLGELAGLLTRNVVINYDGNVEFRYTSTTSFQINSDNFIDFKLLNPSPINYSDIRVISDDDETPPIEVGTGVGYAVEINNQFINDQTTLQTVYNRHFPVNYLSYTMELQGMPHLDVGDIITVEDDRESPSVLREVIIGQHTLEFSGGLKSKMTTERPEVEGTTIDATSGSSVSRAIRRRFAELQGAIQNSTDLITGNEGGNVRIQLDENDKPYEILIMDTADINTAQKVWRWNLSGLGFSNTGYNGEYALAMTIDGAIVADFVSTGSLNADLINTGILQGGSIKFNLDAGTFEIGISSNRSLYWDGSTLTIRANIEMEGGSINWNTVNSDPLISDLQVSVNQLTASIIDLESSDILTRDTINNIRRMYDQIARDSQELISEAYAVGVYDEVVDFQNNISYLDEYTTRLINIPSTELPIVLSQVIYDSGLEYDNGVPYSDLTDYISTLLSKLEASKTKMVNATSEKRISNMANGEYTGGTFIDGRVIYAPELIAGTGTFTGDVEVGGDLIVGGQGVLSAFQFESSSTSPSIVTQGWGDFGIAKSGGDYFKGRVSIPIRIPDNFNITKATIIAMAMPLYFEGFDTPSKWKQSKNLKLYKAGGVEGFYHYIDASGSSNVEFRSGVDITNDTFNTTSWSPLLTYSGSDYLNTSNKIETIEGDITSLLQNDKSVNLYIQTTDSESEFDNNQGLGKIIVRVQGYARPSN